MKIALDYDGTYTADPIFWNQVIALAKERGHEIVCVTMRYPEESIEMSIPVVYTSRQAKMHFHKADIWIDDQPHFLVMSG